MMLHMISLGHNELITDSLKSWENAFKKIVYNMMAIML